LRDQNVFNRRLGICGMDAGYQKTSCDHKQKVAHFFISR
jgi:hypothetical protein